jgi:hypothetical protein
MMTKQQWYDRLKTFLPQWFFETEDYQKAVFMGIAAGLADADTENQETIDATYLTRADGIMLDAHGSERSTLRYDEDETDSQYSPRVQLITNHSNKADLTELIDSLLLIPGCEIHEAPMDSPYCSRASYASRNDIFMEMARNYFLVVAPRQVHAPYSFATREVYSDRENFAGSLNVTTSIFNTVVAAVNAAKAFGVMWGMIEDN